MSKGRYDYRLWTSLPYAGETHPPSNPETPYAGSWSTYFVRRNEDGHFTRLNGSPIDLDIAPPNVINWEAQLVKVKRTIRRLTNTEREIAAYWGSGPATKQWSPIVDILIDTYGVEAPRAARILGALDAGLNDAMVVAWHLKYKWLVARPNQLDQEMVTYICTPRHPTYPSGHATVAGAAEVILRYFFPAEGKRLRQLAEECAASRLFGGVHFPIDNTEGLRLGRQIGSIVTEVLHEERNVENEPIDKPYLDNKHAKLLPPPYEQAIPFDYPDDCQSLVEGQSSQQPNTDTVPKPKLFF
ncbi:vanadium-dependent haloperoxidase [Pontibacillus salicampi]|uniref:Vanadium-dependent haloperoxidase n=1 Tax=Pontibacillus salicampi TaxID=1449801 RepID=A0ABV6LTJ2_9BACI